MTLQARLLTEFVGTFLFLSVIALASRAGVFAPVAIGLGLTAMVYMGGHVSGAHYNPAVSFGLFLRGVISAPTMAAYWLAQLVAGALAFFVGYAISGQTPGIHPGAGVHWYSALVAEIIFTTALVLVVLNVAATRQTAGNSYYGIAIGSQSRPGLLSRVRSRGLHSIPRSASARRLPACCSVMALGRIYGCMLSVHCGGL